MDRSLGERIKQLRKALKLTQSDVSGNEMTKSMLSQIENDLATPSMKNLQYLAAKLGKPVAYFLENETYQISLPMKEIREELSTIDEFKDDRLYQEAIVKLEGMLSKYNFDYDSKLYADLLTALGECFIDSNNFNAGKKKILEAVGIYKKNSQFIEAAKAYMLLLGIPWSDFDYAACLNILKEAVELYCNSISKDYSFEIETLYQRSIISAGLDDLNDSISSISEALRISGKTNIYYRTDELYKNLAIMNVFLGNYEDFDRYIRKARQFAIFTENNKVRANIEGTCAYYKNLIGEPKLALKYADIALKLSSNEFAPFGYTEKAKAFYMLGEYQKALESLELIKYPIYSSFKFDYLLLWSSQIYKGLILKNLKKYEEAIKEIKFGIEKLEIVGESKTLAFAYKSLSDIYSTSQDFENAFLTLKKANEIEKISMDRNLYY